MATERERDWRDSTDALILQAKVDGLRPIELVGAVREHIGAAGINPTPGLVLFRIGCVYDISIGLQNKALRWVGFGPGPRQLSDEEFEELLAPWI